MNKLRCVNCGKDLKVTRKVGGDGKIYNLVESHNCESISGEFIQKLNGLKPTEELPRKPAKAGTIKSTASVELKEAFKGLIK